MNEMTGFEIKSMNVTLDQFEAFRDISRERLPDLSEHEILMLFHAWQTEPVG